MNVETDGDTPGNTGHDSDGAVIESNDAFAQAFAAFASGGTAPGPIEDEPDDEGVDDEAGSTDDTPDDGGEKPPEEGKDGSPPPDAPGDAAAAGKEPDPWADATEAQRAALRKMQDDYEKRLAGAAGRASGLARQLNELQRSRQQPAPEPAASEEEKPDAWKALDDKIKHLKEDYPEIAGPIIELLQAQRDELGQLRGMVAPVIEAGNEEAIRSQVEALSARHADWQEYAGGKNEDFEGWLNSQPENIQRMGRESVDAREVSAVLSLFKTERAEAMQKAKDDNPEPPKTEEEKKPQLDARRQRQLDGGKEVRSRTISTPSGAPEDDFAGAFDHFAKQKAK